MSKLEKSLQEQLKRFNQINRYAKNMIMEQDAPEEDPNAPGAVPPPPPAGGEVPPPPGGDMGGDVPPPPEGGDLGGGGDMGGAPPPPEGGDLGGDVPPPTDDLGGDMDSTEEIDITDLVNMTKSIKKDMENKQSDNVEVVNKMEDIFSKLDELESKLADMDSIIDRIDQLGAKIDAVKEPTPVEKLEMRSLDSYPFNKKPEQFFQEKKGEMERTGKNYQVRPENISDYSKEAISKTFNPESENDEYKY